MGGPNLEIFKFGMYIMFPIGWMYYFGTNLDNKFTVKDFWPTKEQLNKIPTERDEIQGELERLRTKRLLRREQRLEDEVMECCNISAKEEDLHFGGSARKALLVGGPLDQAADHTAQAFTNARREWVDWLRGR